MLNAIIRVHHNSKINGITYIKNSRLYEKEKLKWIETQRKRMLGNTNTLGRKDSIETRKLKSQAHKGTVKPWLYTEEAIQKSKETNKARKRGVGSKNSMANPDNRKKVSDSKIGRKLYFNPITKTRHYIHPNNAPDYYLLGGKS